MNTEPSEREEALERVKQIRAARLDPSMPAFEKWIHTAPIRGLSIEKQLKQCWDDAATRMRERCVQKVAEIRRRHRPSKNQDYEYGFDNALDQVEQDLQLLTLDGEKEQ